MINTKTKETHMQNHKKQKKHNNNINKHKTVETVNKKHKTISPGLLLVVFLGFFLLSSAEGILLGEEASLAINGF